MPADSLDYTPTQGMLEQVSARQDITKPVLPEGITLARPSKATLDECATLGEHIPARLSTALQVQKRVKCATLP